MDVREGNIAAENIAKLIEVAASRGIYWLIEQPSSSAFWEHPSMKHVLELFEHARVWTYIGHWGLKMKKPTILMMNMPEVFEHGLKKDMPNGQNIVKDWGAKKSGRWVAGTKNLADSAAYPERYCEEIAELFELSTTFKKEDLQNDSIWESTCGLKDASNRNLMPGGVKEHAKASGTRKLTDFFKVKQPGRMILGLRLIENKENDPSFMTNKRNSSQPTSHLESKTKVDMEFV